MKLIKDYKELSPDLKGAVIAIGNFDGVHLGHQALLHAAKAKANELKKPLGVLTFEPHPRKLFRPDDPSFRITPAIIKNWRLEICNVDLLYSIPFDWDFASQSAEIFIEHVLKNGLSPSHIIVGDDFCFGQLRKGTAHDLIKSGLETTLVKKIQAPKKNNLSSSEIRTALRHGNIEWANNLLGWEWELRGTIVKGDQRGRELGYPTANVALGETLHPSYGVYASFVKIIEDGPTAPWLPAATNIGIRPMFEIAVGQIESHILDFDRDIYDCTLRIKPLKKLRGEAKFNSLDELISQISKDCDITRQTISVKGA